MPYPVILLPATAMAVVLFVSLVRFAFEPRSLWRRLFGVIATLITAATLLAYYAHPIAESMDPLVRSLLGEESTIGEVLAGWIVAYQTWFFELQPLVVQPADPAFRPTAWLAAMAIAAYIPRSGIYVYLRGRPLLHETSAVSAAIATALAVWMLFAVQVFAVGWQVVLGVPLGLAAVWFVSVPTLRRIAGKAVEGMVTLIASVRLFHWLAALWSTVASVIEQVRNQWDAWLDETVMPGLTAIVEWVEGIGESSDSGAEKLIDRAEGRQAEHRRDDEKVGAAR